MKPELIAHNAQDNRFGNTRPVNIYRSIYTDGGTPAIFSRVVEDGIEVEDLAVYTVCLSGYGITPQPGCAFIKDYSEGKGGVDVLVDNGIVEKVSDSPVSFGPFATTAWEVKIIAGADENTN